MSTRRVLARAALALTALTALATPAAADDAQPARRFTWLSPARRIARTWSASRDTPALNLVVAPRDIRTAGGELAIATIPTAAVTVRTGFAGLLELESDGETTGLGNLFPRAEGAILWRGSYAYYVAVALDRLGPRLCAGCALEVAGQYRHESQHYTGSNHGDAGQDVTAEPFVGDDVIVDAAIERRAGGWTLAARVSGLGFLPERSSYRGGAALDLHARWTAPRVHPFVSLAGEYLAGDDLIGRRFPDAYRVRALAGVALPSTLGDVMLYLAADAGHRKGIRGLTEEATLGVGVRLALGSADR